jgi:hypothetical protein
MNGERAVRTLRTSTAAAGLAAAFAFLTGCSGSSTPGGPAAVASPVVSATPTVSDDGYLPLPLDAYGFVGDDSSTVQQALGILEQHCMAAQGFSSWRPPSAASTSTSATAYNDFPVRPATAADAAQYGYRKPAAPAASAPAANSGTNSPAELQALLGFVPGKQTPPTNPQGGGCSKTAFDTLNQGRPGFDEQLVGQLQDSASAQAGADSRVQAVYRAWSSCMKQNGFDYANPQAAANASWPGKAAGPQEKATAAADLSCRKQTNVVGVWVAVLSGYERELINSNATKLAGVKTAITYELQHAAAIVSQSRA